MKLRDYGIVLYMNTRAIPAPMFEDGPTVGNLFRTIRSVIREWIQARLYARALRKLDFRPLREDEITDEMRAAADAAMRIPREKLRNI